MTPPSIEVRGSGAKDTLGVGEALAEARAGRRTIDTATPPEPGATSRVGGAGPSGPAPSSQRVAAVQRASRATRAPLEPPQSTLQIERKAGPSPELPVGSKGGQVKGTFGEDLTLSPPQFVGRTVLSDAWTAFLAPQDSRAGAPATIGHAGQPFRPAIVPPAYGGPSAAAARVLGSGQTRVGSSAVPTSIALHPGTTEPGAVVAEGAVAAALGRSRTPSVPGSRPGPVRASEGPAARSTGSMAVTGRASAGAQVQVGSTGSGITGSRGRGGSSQELERYAQGEERALALRRQVRDADALARYYDGQGNRAGDEARAALERAEAKWAVKPNLEEPWHDPRVDPHVAEGYTAAVRRKSYAFQMAEHAKDARQALAREYLNEAEAQAERKQRLDRQLGSQWERRLEERQAREQSASARYQATRDRVTTDQLAADVQRRADKRTLAAFSGSPPTLGAAVRMVEGAKALGPSHAERLRALDALDQEQTRLAREVPSQEFMKSGAKSGDAKALERLVADQGRRDQERRRLQRDQDRAAARLASASGKLARLAGRAIDKFSAKIAKREAQLAKAQKKKPRPDPERVARLAGEKQALEAALARVLGALRPPGAPPKPPPPLPQKGPPPPAPVGPPPPAIAPLPSDETIRRFASPSLVFSARTPQSAGRAVLEEREVYASAWGGMERPVGGGADGVASPPHSPRLIGSSTEQSGLDMDGAPAAAPASGASSTGSSVSPPAPAPCPPKCCNITCAAGMVCVCEKAAPSGAGGGGGGGRTTGGGGAGGVSAPPAARIVCPEWMLCDVSLESQPGAPDPSAGSPEAAKKDMLRLGKDLPVQVAGEDGWQPSDEDCLKAAEAWDIPELHRIDQAEALFEALEWLWREATGDIFRALLVDPGHQHADRGWDPDRDWITAAKVRRLGDAIRASRITKEQWLAQVPQEVRQLQAEGFENARKRVAREWLIREWPAATQNREVLRIAQEGPRFWEYVTTYWSRERLEALDSFMRGVTYGGDPLYRAGDPVGEYRASVKFRRELEEATRELKKPKWYDVAPYLVGRLVKGTTFGLFDPSELRDDLGLRGPSSEEVRAYVAANPVLHGLSALAEIGGSLVGGSALMRALQFLGAGAVTSAVVGGAISSGASPEAVAALERGDWNQFLLKVAGGAAASGLGARVAQVAALLAPMGNSDARGLLLGALAGAAVGAASNPAQGITLEGVLMGALQGAVGASLAGGGRPGGRLGTAGGVRAEGEAAKHARYLEQGYSPEAAAELAKQYSGVGHHFVHRSYVTDLIEKYGTDSLRGKFLRAFRDSPWNVKKPTWMTKGEFYEWHARLHGASGEAAFGLRTAQGARLLPGEAWQSAKVVEGLESYGKLGYLWQGSPTRLKVAVGGTAVGVGAGGYAVWDAVTPDGSAGK